MLLLALTSAPSASKNASLMNRQRKLSSGFLLGMLLMCNLTQPAVEASRVYGVAVAFRAASADSNWVIVFYFIRIPAFFFGQSNVFGQRLRVARHDVNNTTANAVVPHRPVRHIITLRHDIAASHLIFPRFVLSTFHVYVPTTTSSGIETVKITKKSVRLRLTFTETKTPTIVRNMHIIVVIPCNLALWNLALWFAHLHQTPRLLIVIVVQPITITQYRQHQPVNGAALEFIVVTSLDDRY